MSDTSSSTGYDFIIEFSDGLPKNVEIRRRDQENNQPISAKFANSKILPHLPPNSRLLFKGVENDRYRASYDPKDEYFESAEVEKGAITPELISFLNKHVKFTICSEAAETMMKLQGSKLQFKFDPAEAHKIDGFVAQLIADWKSGKRAIETINTEILGQSNERNVRKRHDSGERERKDEMEVPRTLYTREDSERLVVRRLDEVVYFLYDYETGLDCVYTRLRVPKK